FILRSTCHDMIVTPGPRDKYNTGQWLVKACDWSMYLLHKTWSEVKCDDSCYWRNPWEQRAFTDLVKRNPEFADRICVLPMREMNSRPKAEYVDLCPELAEIDYQPGDFIVHFYHTKNPTLRLRGMTDYYDQWVNMGSHLVQRGLQANADRFDGGYKWAARQS